MTSQPFSVLDLLDQAHPDRVLATRDGEDRTFAAVADRSAALAAKLAGLGVRRGDRVCLHLPKSLDEIELTFAILRAGAVVVNVNSIVTTRQLRHALRDSGATVLICLPRKAKSVIEADESIDGPWPSALQVIATVGGGYEHEQVVVLDDLDEGRIDSPRRIGADPAFIMYTSGSTGLPKGVLLNHATVVDSARSAASHLENAPDDRIIGVLPLSFDFGLSQLMTMTLVGGTLVLPRAALPAEVVTAVLEQGVNGLAMVPTMWIPLARKMRDDGIVLDNVRYLANSGGPLPSDVREAWPELFPNARPYLMYGMTEGFRSTYLPPADFHRKPGSIGVPLPDVEIYVIDETGDRRCEPGEVGQIIHRSRSLMSSGYYGNPEATAEKIRPCPQLADLIGDEPVLYSGDTGHLDEDGYLFFAARTSTFIKCSDFRVSPTEVEDVAFSSGVLNDAVAFGVPDEMLGQVVHLAVAGPAGAEVDTAAVQRQCRASLPPYAAPKQIHVWPEAMMPRTANGKVDRPTVIDTFTPDTP